jgi:hypothetical protein
MSERQVCTTRQELLTSAARLEETSSESARHTAASSVEASEGRAADDPGTRPS